MAGTSSARFDALISDRVENKVEDVISKIQGYATSVAIMATKKPEEAREPFRNLAERFNRFNIDSTELQRNLSFVSPKEEQKQDIQKGFES